MKLAIILLTLLPAAAFAGGAKEERSAAAEDAGGGKLSVFVSILPQRFFAREIGGEYADVQVLVQPGESPHSYEPKPSQVTALGSADLLFTIGVDFEEGFVPEIRSALPKLTIVESDRGIRYRDSAGHDDEHAHEGDDPHVWLSPANGKIIARNMKEAFAAQAPEHADSFEENYRLLLTKIDEVERELRKILAPLQGETFLVFHPAFGYFADEYGLEQEAIETGGNEPTPKQLEAIIREAKADGVRVIFVQPQFARKSAETIASAIGGAVIPIDPLAPDWLANLQKMAEHIRKGIGG
jgi:zinc transport system substrate-binding protein